MQPFSTEMRVFRNVALLSHTRVTCCGSPRAPKYSHEQGEQAERTPQGQGRVKFEPKRRSSITMQHGRHGKATLKLRESHRLDRGDFWGCLPNMYGPTTQYYLATRDRRAVPRAEIWRRAAISGKSASPPLCPAPDFQDRQGWGLGKIHTPNHLQVDLSYFGLNTWLALTGMLAKSEFVSRSPL